MKQGIKPGELILLSSRPGLLMGQLSRKYGEEAMKTIRASRVDYYTQHDPTIWKDNFLSLGLEGEDCVFVNLAAVAGPKVRPRRDSQTLLFAHLSHHLRYVPIVHVHVCHDNLTSIPFISSPLHSSSSYLFLSIANCFFHRWASKTR